MVKEQKNVCLTQPQREIKIFKSSISNFSSIFYFLTKMPPFHMEKGVKKYI
jgi:hypothetical protein